MIFVHPDLYLIWDELDSKVPAVFNYHPIATRMALSDGGVHIQGRYGVDTDFVVLSPQKSDSRIEMDEDRRMDEEKNIWNSQEINLWGRARWLKLRARPGEDFLVLIHPYQGKSRLAVNKRGDGSWEFLLGPEKGRIVREGKTGEARLRVSFGGERVECRAHSFK